MRNIKFRAWHNGNKNASGNYIKDHEPQMLYDEKAGDCLIWKQHQNIDIVEQFTGLQDVNGVDIYEGDICIMHMPNMWGDDGELSKEVKNITTSFVWKNNGWCLDGFNHLYGTYYWGSIKGEMLEVIGNIHQTK